MGTSLFCSLLAAEFFLGCFAFCILSLRGKATRSQRKKPETPFGIFGFYVFSAFTARIYSSSTPSALSSFTMETL
ncbi:MAG: hypothetical protein J6W67_04040, partial [Lentisphaeria bacterium]|nr:hypothetical protein [Lentisphaeria bacterium]